MFQGPDKVLDSGIDYITATARGRNTESSLSAFGRFIVNEQIQRGEKVRNFYFSGYRGSVAGSASYGVRHDGSVIRLSSGVAKEYWAQVYHLCTNVSRLDLQVTVRPAEGPIERLTQHHAEMQCLI